MEPTEHDPCKHSTPDEHEGEPEHRPEPDGALRDAQTEEARAGIYPPPQTLADEMD